MKKITFVVLFFLLMTVPATVSAQWGHSGGRVGKPTMPVTRGGYTGFYQRPAPMPMYGRRMMPVRPVIVNPVYGYGMVAPAPVCFAYTPYGRYRITCFRGYVQQVPVYAIGNGCGYMVGSGKAMLLAGITCEGIPAIMRFLENRKKSHDSGQTSANQTTQSDQTNGWHIVGTEHVSPEEAAQYPQAATPEEEAAAQQQPQQQPQ